MTLTLTRTLLLTLLVSAFLFIAPQAFANDGADDGLEASVSSETDVNVKPKPILPLRMLDRKEDRLDEAEDRFDRREDRRDAATSTGVKDRLEDMRDKREDVRDKSEDLREKGRENAVNRIKGHLRHFYSVLEAAINRMGKLEDRVQARADKLEAEGENVGEAEGFLVTANAELALATADLASIKTLVNASTTVTASTTPATVFRPVQDLLKSAREHIGNAWDSIKDAVQSLRALSSDDTP